MAKGLAPDHADDNAGAVVDGHLDRRPCFWPKQFRDRSLQRNASRIASNISGCPGYRASSISQLSIHSCSLWPDSLCVASRRQRYSTGHAACLR